MDCCAAILRHRMISSFLIVLSLTANLVAAFQFQSKWLAGNKGTSSYKTIQHRLHETSSSSPAAFSNLNETDWISITNNRLLALNDDEITYPKPLSFMCGIKFLIASSRGRAHIYLNKLREEHGDAFIIWNKYVTINDVGAIRDIVETYNLPKQKQVLKGYEFFFGSGSILAAPWEDWKKQRRMSNAALVEAGIGPLITRLREGVVPIMELLEHVSSTGSVVEMDKIFQSAATDVIGLVIFGKSFGIGKSLIEEVINTASTSQEKGMDDLNVFKSMDLMKIETQRQMVLPEWILKIAGPPRKVKEAKAYLDCLLDDCIEERLKTQEQSGVVDLMTVLLDSYNKGTITREEVKGQLLTFLFAGQDTTAHTLSWMLYEISQNTTLQEQLFEEIKEVLPDRDTAYANSTMLQPKQLALLDRTFSETLRKFPAAATGTSRLVGDNPILVGQNLKLPAGASLTIPPYALHRHPHHWPDPEKFDPSRFLSEQMKSRNPMAFQAFSSGPRNCVGSYLARVQALFIMSALIRRYRVSCVEKDLPPKQYHAITMKPKHGIRFTFTKRD